MATSNNNQLNMVDQLDAEDCLLEAFGMWEEFTREFVQQWNFSKEKKKLQQVWAQTPIQEKERMQKEAPEEYDRLVRLLT